METTIKVENLSKSYANVKAVDHLNLSICRGEGFGLLGANGAGKSKRVNHSVDLPCLIKLCLRLFKKWPIYYR
uniref:hypothetical protein n=1 Tax=Paenibacillus suaedae TaxID=3077233 RepID=UPI003742B54B